MNIFRKKPTWKLLFVEEGRVREETLSSAVKNLPIRVVIGQGMGKTYSLIDTKVEVR